MDAISGKLVIIPLFRKMPNPIEEKVGHYKKVYVAITERELLLGKFLCNYIFKVFTNGIDLDLRNNVSTESKHQK